MVEIYPYKTEIEKTPKQAVLRHELRFLFIEFEGGNSSQFSRSVNFSGKAASLSSMYNGSSTQQSIRMVSESGEISFSGRVKSTFKNNDAS